MNSASPKYIPTSSESGPGLDSTTLFLALYIIMLSFFILLNSISFPDHAKTEDAISSVTTTFETNLATQLSNSLLVAPKGDDLNLGEYFATLKTLAERELQLVSHTINNQGNTMQVIFPTSAFFDTGQAELRSQKEAFMKDVAKNLTSPSYPGIHTDIDITISSESYMRPEGNVSLDIMRAGAFARKLESLGINTSYIHTGILPGGKEEITITFRLRMDDTIPIPVKKTER